MLKPRDVHLFLLDSLADWEIGYVAAFLNRPAPGVPSRYRVRTVAETLDPVRSIGGLTLVPDMQLSELSPADSALLILPGADTWTEQPNTAILTKAQAFVAAGVPVAGICGATFGLAQAGLLDQRRHTSNDPSFLAQSGYQGGEHYVYEPAVADQGVITASSTAPLEFARLLLAELDAFPHGALEPWYGLFKTGEPEHYFKLVEVLSSGGAA